MPLVLGGILCGAVLAVVNPAWAGSVQTLLLIVLAVVTYLTNRNVKTAQGQNDQILQKGEQIHEDVLQTKANSTHAASAAAAAAATARDSSRIVKDVGALFRATRDPNEEAKP